MAFRTKKTMWGALIALLLVIPLLAYALVEPKHVGGEIRTMRISIPSVQEPSATEVTEGTNGVVGILDMFTTVAVAAPTDTTPNALPYPARLTAMAIDGGAATAAALSCTSVTINGRDQFGTSVSETVGSATNTVGETSANARTTLRAFSILTSVSAAGCVNGADTGDDVRVAIAPYQIGLPMRLRVIGDVLGACLVDASASDVTMANVISAADSTLCYTGAQLNTAGAISVQYSVVDMADAQLATVAAEGDAIMITQRPNLPMP